MTQDAVQALISQRERPVILIEGTRQLTAQDQDLLAAFARGLAQRYPHAWFRTGNADGSDAAFARGVAGIDPARLEFLLPYAGHRTRMIPAAARQVALEALSADELEQLIALTLQASPKYAGMIAQRDRVPRLRAKSLYLLRDTLKVIGAQQAGLARATLGVFFANVRDPMAGGTGHTIRVCQLQGVPAVLQDEWFSWPIGA